jgi:hypothetical protein
MDHTNPSKYGHEDANPLSSLLQTFQGKSGKALSNNILKYVQMTLLVDKTQKFIWHTSDEPWNSSYIHVWWTQIQDHDEHNNILKYHDEHNNILKYPKEHNNILIYIVAT